VLEDGWRARRLAGGELLLEDDGPTRAAAAAAADPARIEIFNNLFMHIAEQMGEVLRATAQSVNIRERLDYSCALFDSHGGLVANAPHMPVHLGSMARACGGHRGATGTAACGGLLATEQSLSRRHPSAGYDGGDAGLHGGRRGRISSSPRARITPTSAG